MSALIDFRSFTLVTLLITYSQQKYQRQSAPTLFRFGLVSELELNCKFPTVCLRASWVLILHDLPAWQVMLSYRYFRIYYAHKASAWIPLS